MKSKFMTHMSNDELLEQLVDELVKMHTGTYIDLSSWPTALEIVRRFYCVETSLVFKGRKADLAKKKVPTLDEHQKRWREKYENQVNNKRSCSPDC